MLLYVVMLGSGRLVTGDLLMLPRSLVTRGLGHHTRYSKQKPKIRGACTCKIAKKPTPATPRNDKSKDMPTTWDDHANHQIIG